MDPTHPDPDALYWLARAGSLLSFIRRSDLVVSIDREVWLFSGNAEDQVAAFLQSTSLCAVPPQDIEVVETAETE